MSLIVGVYNELVVKVNTIDTMVPNGELVSKTQYDLEKQNLLKNIEGVDKEIPNTSNFTNMQNFNRL